MKNIALVMAMVISKGLFAQVQDSSLKTSDYKEIKTLFSKDADFGFYLGANVSRGDLNSSNSISGGVRLAWVIDHKLGFGFSTYAFSQVNDIDQWVNGTTISGIQGGYGAFFIEPILFPKQIVHLSFPIDFGIGVIQAKEGSYEYNQTGLYNNNGPFGNSIEDVVLVFEPSVEVEVNVFKHFRLGVNASYRMFRDLNIDGIHPDGLNGLTTGMSLKLGGF